MGIDIGYWQHFHIGNIIIGNIPSLRLSRLCYLCVKIRFVPIYTICTFYTAKIRFIPIYTFYTFYTAKIRFVPTFPVFVLAEFTYSVTI